MLLFETDIDRFTEHDLVSMTDDLPPSWQARIQRKTSAKARLQSIVGYTLLKTIFQKHCGIDELPSLRTDENGKPHLETDGLYFSISHCRAAVVCIVETHPVGVDIQDMLTDISPALAARIAAPNDPATMSVRELTALWTQKEASAKLDGRGLKIGLEHLPLKDHRVETMYGSDFVVSVAKKAPQHT